MQKTGTIAQIVPDGGYQSQRGYIYTFQMTIQCPDGTFEGQIGSKSEQYPLSVGQEIIVDMTNTQHGVRFKKINPQYAGQNAQNTPQGRSQGGGGQENSPTKELAIKRGNALNAVFSATTIPQDLISDYLVASMGWLNNGDWKLMPPNMNPKAADDMPIDDDIPF